MLDRCSLSDSDRGLLRSLIEKLVGTQQRPMLTSDDRRAREVKCLIQNAAINLEDEGAFSAVDAPLIERTCTRLQLSAVKLTEHVIVTTDSGLRCLPDQSARQVSSDDVFIELA